ncbi:sugar ABC transporter ATP-binding protein [bacterium]|nr:sugar ABC transporter ATP-binding protein [bacterium]
MDSLLTKNISKSFPGVKALIDVDFEVRAGEIHALVGANGAGKSTLMKILSGAYTASSGNIFINNKEIDIQSPGDAKKNGIVIVYQEVDTALVPHLTVGENIMMDYLVNEQKSIFVNWKKIHTRAQKEIDDLGLSINSKQLISDLTLHEKQMVLIGRAVYQNAKYLLLDEPTAALSITETEKLFVLIEKLRKDGMGIVFISHRLDEVFKTCEKITVLRDGKLVNSFTSEDTDIDTVVETMLGKKMDSSYPEITTEFGDPIFEVENLSGTGDIHDVNLYARAGEIIGITGLIGAGKTELCKLLFGLGDINTGKITVKNKELSLNSPSDAVKQGLALVPEERRKEGVLVGESLATNITLPTLDEYCSKSFMNTKKIRKKAIDTIKKVHIKTPNEKQLVANLSGGNQQKVVIGKWLISQAEVFLLDEPTKGVDIGSKSEIYSLIDDLAKQKKCIIYASCEFSEILGLTHRTYVMYSGTIVKELETKKTSEEELLYYSTGGRDFGKK